MLGSPAVGTASGPSLFPLLPPRPLPPQVRFLAGHNKLTSVSSEAPGEAWGEERRAREVGGEREGKGRLSDWEAGERGLVVREKRDAVSVREIVYVREKNYIERKIKIL